MIKYVFFDLDDTILDFQRSERSSLIKMLKNYGYTPTEEQVLSYNRINLSQWKRLEKGELTHAQVKVSRYEIFFKEIGLDISGAEATKIYEDYLRQSYFMLDGAREMLDELYKEYPLYIVTNGLKRDQLGRMKGANIEKYFKGFFNSQDLGYSKPDSRFFDVIFSQIPQFEKDKAVIVGDSLTSDVKGGINAGIKTVWFNRKKEINDSDIIPDFEVKELFEIKKVLKNM